MMRGRLHFLIGVQRSGKTTYADQWARRVPRVEHGIMFPRVIVCADNIRTAVTGERYNRRAEPVVFMVKDYMTEALLSRGMDVLIDGTHTTKISIRRVLEIDPHATWTLINTPATICKQRAIDTEQEDLLPVIDRCQCQLDTLLVEGIDNVIRGLREEIIARRGK